jgi:hypothetical protein
MNIMGSSVSRRDFLTTAVGAGGAMLLGPPWLHATGEAVDARVAKVVSGIIGIDMHNHVYPVGTEPHPQPQPGQPHGRRSSRRVPAFRWPKS